MTTLSVCVDFENAWKNAPTLNGVVPFFDTINTEPDPSILPSLWGSVVYADAFETRISIGSILSLYREEGIISIAIFSRSGQGKDEAMSAAETFRDFFRSYIGMNGYLFINSSNPIRIQSVENIAGDFGLFFVDLTYRYDYYK